MRRITFATYQTLFGAVYLGLMTNLLLAVACLPLVVLLVTTDPAGSWPLLALAAPLCGPAFAAAATTFREHGRGSGEVVRSFVAGYRATWRRALALGAVASFALVVLLADVRFFAGSDVAIFVVPLLGVLVVLALAVVLVALVAVAEAPEARMRDVLKASLYLAVRRWYLTVASLVVLGGFVWFFTVAPALALGLAAAPALYLAWANSRFSLRPVLDVDDVVPADSDS